MKPILFYFDLSSPYAYLMAHRIDQLATRFDRQVEWHPILLGAVFKISGSSPLANQPIKWEYAQKDVARMARFMELPWTLPEPFPIAAIASSRAFYWINDQDPGLAKRFAVRCFDIYFGEGRNIAKLEVLTDIVVGLGLDGDEMQSAIKDPAIKDKLKQETDSAIEIGVCGSPYIIIDGEPFWGADRLWMIRRWLHSGGW